MLTRANIVWYDSLDSTNKEARRLLDKGLLTDRLSIVAAKSQSAGRGQGDHIWLSQAGKNLTFSLVMQGFGIPVKSQQIINTVLCPAICSLLEEEGVRAWVKAPNDIWVEDRKICGILVENILREGEILASIAGIGLNVNQTEWPVELPNPVSLKDLTGKDYDLPGLLVRLEKNFRAECESVLPDLSL